ncbi:helix-turn-helix domain-containing protein [Vulcanococcus sp.]|uniref:helix-turn-helix domain-containing protein n=1 Tax=Vulcanococcus sp. TaxID=2856995 RepID=UPI003C0C59B9
MAAPRLTESQKQELVARYRQGETAQALASSYGCSPNTVSRVLKAGIDADELASLKKQSRSKTAPQAAPALAVEPVAEAPEPEDEEQSLSAPVAELDAQPAASLEDDEEYGDDIDEDSDDGIEDSFEDDDDEEVSSTFNLKAGVASTQALVDPIPLLPGLLPSSVYMLVDKVVELQAKPLNEFPELGSLPETEQERQALMLYTNPRQAKRQCGRSQRVIKVPDSDVLQRRSSYLVAQGITRLVVEGGLLYSLPGS